MQEYIQAKAAKEVPWEGTKYMVPWFVIQEGDSDRGTKSRLISDCRGLNTTLNPPKFKLDHWRDIFPHLEKVMWATRVDLKNTYFHLNLAPPLEHFVRMQIE